MKRKVAQILLAVVVVALFGVLLLMRNSSQNAGPEPDTGAAGGQLNPDKQDLVIISPHWDGIKDEFENAFDRWHAERYGKGVDIKWRDIGAGSGSILRFVEDQFRKNPAGIGIDVIFGGGSDLYTRIADKFQPLKLEPDVLKGLTADIGGMELYDPRFRWFGAALSGFGIIYNKPLLAKYGLPEPNAWEDISAPKAYRLVSSADPRRSGANHMCYEIILQAYGWDKGYEIVTRLVANIRKLSNSSSEAIDEVELGNCAYGLAIDFYAWSKISEIGADRLGYVTPEALSVINPDPIAVFKGAPNAEVAQRFVDFVLSDAGQKLWMLAPGKPGGPAKYCLERMAVRPGVYEMLGDESLIKLNPFKWQSAFKYDTQKGANRYDALNSLLGAALLNPKKELQEAWEAVMKRGIKPDEVRFLCTPPVSEAELTRLAGLWKDSAVKQKTLAEWEQWARKRYEKLAAGGL